MQTQIATPAARLALMLSLKLEILNDALHHRVQLTGKELNKLLSDLKDIKEKAKTLH